MRRSLFAVTGGPGSGKTTLCEAIAKTGINIVGESGRAVIRDELSRGGTALLWCDPPTFAAAIMLRDHEQYQAAQQLSDPVIFDRGFPDNVGYLTMLGWPVPAQLNEFCCTLRYEHPVFIAPPWREIYVQDTERIQNWEEAVRTYESMIAAYDHYGYEMVELPIGPVAMRVEFVRHRIKLD